MRNTIPTAKQCAEQINTDGSPEFIKIDLGDRPVLDRGTAGIVVDHVQPAVGLHCARQSGLHRIRIADIGLNCLGNTAARHDLIGELLVFGGLSITKRQPGTFCGKKPRGGTADAAGRAGDQRSFPLQTAAHQKVSPEYSAARGSTLTQRTRSAHWR